MSGTMEFSITTNLEPLKSFAINANFDECRRWLDENLTPYRTMVVTEDGISTAKKYRANIRAVASRIDECRKMAKAAALSSYLPFEEKCKALTALCAESADNLDGQIKAFDETRRGEKREALQRYFFENVGEMNDFLTFEAIFNPRWLNATYSEEQAHIDICAEIAKCMSAVGSIRALHSEFEMTLLDEFRKNHDLAACIQKNANLVRLKEIEDQRRKEREARERRAAEQAAAAEEARTQAAQAAVLAARNIVTGEKPELPPEEPIVYRVEFAAYGTKKQLDDLKEYMNRAGIRFGRAN